MEFTLPTSTRNLLKKRTLYRRDSLNGNLLNQDESNTSLSTNEIKILAMYCLIKQFMLKKQQIIEKYDQQINNKLNKTGMHFNRTSSTLAIQPMKKEIVQLKKTEQFMENLSIFLENRLKNNEKRQSIRRFGRSAFSTTYNISCSNIDGMVSTINNSPTHTKFLKQNDQDQTILPKSRQKVYSPSRLSQSPPSFPQTLPSKLKQNIAPSPSQQQNQQQQSLLISNQSSPKNSSHKKSKHKHNNNHHHRRYQSDLTFMTRKSYPIKQLSNAQRRQKIFMLKKKQQMNFIRKITMEFNSQSSQFKALVQTMQIYTRNVNRANYYLKTIDQIPQKYKIVQVYLKQLLKIFQPIFAIFYKLSALHPSFTIKPSSQIHNNSPYFNPQPYKNSSNSQQKPPSSYSPFSSSSNNNNKPQYHRLDPLIQQYYKNCSQIIRIMRIFTLSPLFQNLITPQRNQCVKLVEYFVQARYILRYLEKQIENLEVKKYNSNNNNSNSNNNNNNNNSIPKWQKAFRVKFLPKNNYI